MSIHAALMGEAICIAIALTTGCWLIGWILDEIEKKM
jgi:hypothetical protein